MPARRRFFSHKVKPRIEEFAPPADIPFDELWNPKLVEARLVEAAILCVKTGGPVLPKGFKGSMPAYAYDWGDLLNQVETDEIGKGRNYVRTGASAKEVSRMEEAILWPWRYLEKFEGPRRVLKVYLNCKAHRRKFGSACKARGWSRATGYRARDRALAIIAIGLNRDRVAVRTGGIEEMNERAPRRATHRDDDDE